MTDGLPRTFGRSLMYPIDKLNIDDTLGIHVPTTADVKRVAKNVSQYGQRHDKGFRCKTNRKTRMMIITRVR
jgi:hypothetical protein